MKTVDINSIDKKNFKCYKFHNDKSFYYGEVAYLDEMNNIIEENILTEDMKIKLRLVRNGMGVMMYNVIDQNCESRYEGNWFKDRKTGLGKYYYSDHSIYEGNFHNDLYEGYGCFTWPNNDMYLGEWKLGKFDGEGEFRHNDGHILKGKFTNNYFLDVSGSIEYVI